MGTVNEGTPFKFKVVGLYGADKAEGACPSGLDCKLSDPSLGEVAFQADGTAGAVAFKAAGKCQLLADAGGFHDEIDLEFVAAAPPPPPEVVGIKIIET